MYFERDDDDMEASKRRSVLLSLMFKCFTKHDGQTQQICEFLQKRCTSSANKPVVVFGLFVCLFVDQVHCQ